MYRGLSGYFYDRLALGLVYNTEKKLCQKLNINKFLNNFKNKFG